MLLLLGSFIAGVLTIAAPCILPLLPVIIGGSVARSGGDDRRLTWLRPVVIALSLGVSVIIFSLILRASTALLGVPDQVWQFVSAGIILLLGVSFIKPELWDIFSAKIGLHQRSNKLLGASSQKKGLGGDVAIGAALGPVFLSCSPTYLLVVGAILPADFWQGMAYLLAYAIGLAGALLCVAFFGQRVVKRLGWLSNPAGWFYKVVGFLFIAVALLVVTGWDRDFQAYVLDQGWYAPIEGFERRFR